MKSSANAFSRNGRATKRNTYFLYSLYWSTWGGGGLVLVGLQTLKTTVNIINNLQFLGLLWIIFKPVPHKLRLQSIYKDVLSSSLRSSFNNKIFIWHLLFGKMESTSKNRNPTQDWTSLIMRKPPPPGPLKTRLGRNFFSTVTTATNNNNKCRSTNEIFCRRWNMVLLFRSEEQNVDESLFCFGFGFWGLNSIHQQT